jgi:hypothetical protein
MIHELELAIEVYSENRAAGEPWPGSCSDETPANALSDPSPQK